MAIAPHVVILGAMAWSTCAAAATLRLRVARANRRARHAATSNASTRAHVAGNRCCRSSTSASNDVAAHGLIDHAAANGSAA